MNEERKKFYLTSQLTYGTLIFYRWQTDNLLGTILDSWITGFSIINIILNIYS
jgi:hypothetical protein